MVSYFDLGEELIIKFTIRIKNRNWNFIKIYNKKKLEKNIMEKKLKNNYMLRYKLD